MKPGNLWSDDYNDEEINEYRTRIAQEKQKKRDEKSEKRRIKREEQKKKKKKNRVRNKRNKNLKKKKKTRSNNNVFPSHNNSENKDNSDNNTHDLIQCDNAKNKQLVNGNKIKDCDSNQAGKDLLSKYRNSENDETHSNVDFSTFSKEKTVITATNDNKNNEKETDDNKENKVQIEFENINDSKVNYNYKYISNHADVPVASESSSIISPKASTLYRSSMFNDRIVKEYVNAIAAGANKFWQIPTDDAISRYVCCYIEKCKYTKQYIKSMLNMVLEKYPWIKCEKISEYTWIDTNDMNMIRNMENRIIKSGYIFKLPQDKCSSDVNVRYSYAIELKHILEMHDDEYQWKRKKINGNYIDTNRKGEAVISYVFDWFGNEFFKHNTKKMKKQRYKANRVRPAIPQEQMIVMIESNSKGKQQIDISRYLFTN